jgi:hypothetical protein
MPSCLLLISLPTLHHIFSPEASGKDALSALISLLSFFQPSPLISTSSSKIFLLILIYTPWTYSFTHPLADVEYADDTVLIARTNYTLCGLLHLLQHLAARIGLQLNESKCQLLTIHASLPGLSLSLVADSDTQCNCPCCAPFFYATPDISSLDVPLPPRPSAKYLGSYITPTSSSNPDVNFRCSQTSSAFKTLDPFFDTL